MPSLEPVRRLLPFGAAAIVVAAALVFAPGAGAVTNLVPNASFEQDCSGIPCNWASFADPGASASITRDTTSPHTGSASLHAQTTVGADASLRGGGRSDCITGITGNTTYFISYWVRENDQNTVSYAMWVDFYSDANCATNISTGVPGLGVGADHQDTWLHWATSGDSPATAQSARVFLGVRCVATGSCTANFDDVFLGSEPLAATFTTLTAMRARRGVLVRWRTGTEVDVLGFNVYRQVNRKRVKVNRSLIPAKGNLSGARYSFLDRRSAKATRARYWVRTIDLDGRGTWHGPAVTRTS